MDFVLQDSLQGIRAFDNWRQFSNKMQWLIIVIKP